MRGRGDRDACRGRRSSPLQAGGESQAATEGKTCELLSEVAVKADSVGIVLEDESKAELCLAVVEGRPDSGVLHTLRNAELPLRSSRQALARFEGCGARIWVDTDTSVDVRGRVPGSEVVPVDVLAERLP
jgi:hypothetical protein